MPHSEKFFNGLNFENYQNAKFDLKSISASNAYKSLPISYNRDFDQRCKLKRKRLLKFMLKIKTKGRARRRLMERIFVDGAFASPKRREMRKSERYGCGISQVYNQGQKKDKENS